MLGQSTCSHCCFALELHDSLFHWRGWLSGRLLTRFSELKVRKVKRHQTLTMSLHIHKLPWQRLRQPLTIYAFAYECRKSPPGILQNIVWIATLDQGWSYGGFVVLLSQCVARVSFDPSLGYSPSLKQVFSVATVTQPCCRS